MNIQERLRHAAQWGVTEADGRPRADVMIEAADYIDLLESKMISVRGELRPQELRVAAALFQRRGDLVPSDDLMRIAAIPSRDVLKVIICHVRRKLDGKAKIETVRGVGYRMLR
jgi:DNA-binding response OmpR family regulator